MHHEELLLSQCRVDNCLGWLKIGVRVQSPVPETAFDMTVALIFSAKPPSAEGIFLTGRLLRTLGNWHH